MNEIMRRIGKSKTCVWRWQERFMQEAFDGLLSETRQTQAQSVRFDPPIERRLPRLERRDAGLTRERVRGMQTQNPSRRLTTKETARFLNLSSSRLRRWPRSAR